MSIGSDVCGWYCPLCGHVNAPHLDQCLCTEDKKEKSVLDDVPVKMTSEAKSFFGNKEEGMRVQSKEP